MARAPPTASHHDVLPTIRNTLHRFVEDLRHEFDENRRRPPLRPNEPPFAGSAVWAHSLARGVEEAWSHLRNCRHMAKAMASDEAEAALCMGACKDAQSAYTGFVSVVGDFKANRYGPKVHV